MKKFIPFLAAAFLALSCNKVIDEVPLPPFNVFPNPFHTVFQFNLDNRIPVSARVSVRILDGAENEIARVDNVTPGNSLAFQLTAQEKGFYYVEATIDEEVFIQPVLKTGP